MSETMSEYLARTAHLVNPDPYAGTDYEGKAYCRQDGRWVRISEHNAFGGRDTSRVTLACGHVVDKPEILR